MAQAAMPAMRTFEEAGRTDVEGENTLMPFGMEGLFTVGAAVGHGHDQPRGDHKEDRTEDHQWRRKDVPRHLILLAPPVDGAGRQSGCQQKKQRKVENNLLFHEKTSFVMRM